MHIKYLEAYNQIAKWLALGREDTEKTGDFYFLLLDNFMFLK